MAIIIVEGCIVGVCIITLMIVGAQSGGFHNHNSSKEDKRWYRFWQLFSLTWIPMSGVDTEM